MEQRGGSEKESKNEEKLRDKPEENGQDGKIKRRGS